MVLNKKHIFIVGAPQSTKKQLAAMIEDHPLVCAATVFNRTFSAFIQKGDTASKINEKTDFKKDKLISPFTGSDDNKFIKEFLNNYYQDIYSDNPEATHILDTQSPNASQTKIIKKFIPHAMFIHITKNGLEISSSLVARTLGIETSGRNTANVSTADLTSQQPEKDPYFYLKIKHEDLLNNGDITLRSIFKYCDLTIAQQQATIIYNNHPFEETKTYNNLINQNSKAINIQNNFRDPGGSIESRKIKSQTTQKDFLHNSSPIEKARRSGKSTIKKYGRDETGTKTYCFNEYGYRGETYNPENKCLIYSGGCSHAFGVGLNWQETYSYHFKKLYSDYFNIDINNINLMSFSGSASPNSYNVRTLITQCNVIKPDILICNFSHKKNLELVSDDNLTALFCPTLPGNKNSLLNHPVCNELHLLVESLKNILLLQYYCVLNKIEYVFGWMNIEEYLYRIGLLAKTHRFIQEELDMDHFIKKSINGDMKIDFAADGWHGGVQTNKKYGELVFNKYINLYHEELKPGKKSVCSTQVLSA